MRESAGSWAGSWAGSRAAFRLGLPVYALLLWLALCAVGACTAAHVQAATSEPVRDQAAGNAGVSRSTSSLPSELQLRRARFTVAARQITTDYQLGLKGLIPIRDQLREGAHMSVEGTIRLMLHNLLRPNSEVAVRPLAWRLRHDPLTRDFLIVDASVPNGQVHRSPHLDSLLRDAWKDLHATLDLEEPLEDDETYIVRFDLVLRYAEVPPWLQKALFFWTWELSPPLSYEHSFTWQDD